MNTRSNLLEKPIEILLVEDNPGDVRLIREVLKDSKFHMRINGVQTGDDALAFLQRKGEFSKAPTPDLILLDLNLPGKDGREVLADIKSDPVLKEIPILILTGSNSDSDVRFAYESNANFFIAKPMGVEHFSALLGYLEDFLIKSLDDKNRGKHDLVCHIVIKSEEEWHKEIVEMNASRSSSNKDEIDGFIARSPNMRELMDMVKTVSKVDSTVLITGESGTGKERIAKFLHSQSSRAKALFVAVNCGAISETLLESELFGHAKGAFTDASTDRQGLFEAANGGTIFLDEIGEISPSLQVKLLRVLQERQVRRVGENKSRDIDVRILSATNKDLSVEVEAKRFREDLLYRLKIIEVAVPPLRTRREDILPLARLLIEQAAYRMMRPIKGFSPLVAEKLVRYHWPGNVRELENVMERAVALAKGSCVDLGDLPQDLLSDKLPVATSGKTNLLETIERDAIMEALNESNGNRCNAATALGVGVATLYRKLKRYKQEDLKLVDRRIN